MNFFEYSEPVNAVERFGIRDDEEGKQAKEMPAFVDYTEKALWNAEIVSDNRNDFNFIAVDKQIPYFDEKGNQNSLCDAIVWTPNTIVFIELKTGAKSWLTEAIAQLKSTINFFQTCEDIQKFKYKKAYACNKQHPNFHYQQSHVMQAFVKKTGVVLRTEKEIKGIK
ncbi:MAG: hypothetical protein P1P60_01005 [Treponema phagedenis]|uniref:hypothetical protein n=1 Tax=Treponema phagedenis TaxID=162 RepID=UPI003133D715